MNQKERQPPHSTHVAAQVAAAWANLDAASRASDLASSLASQDRAFLDAMRETQAVRAFVGTPENILGSATTKHGEIAEQVNVAIARARDMLSGNATTSTFEGVGRTSPIDYLRDGVGVQAKYCNGLRNTLGGVSEHATKYPVFARGEGIYDIPRDQHEQLGQLVQTGRVDGLSDNSANSIRGRLDVLEQQTGRSADDLLRPGDATYSEAQQGRVHDTIRDRESELSRTNEQLKEAARTEHGPSLSGLGRAAAIGAVVGGGVLLAQGIWVKYREGKNPFRGEFKLEDWIDVGVPAAQGAGGGAIAGGGVYLLTNSTSLAAPVAGSVVSGLMGIGTLLRRYHAGEISGQKFVDMSQMVMLDSAIVGLASATGQVLIPVPVVGALVGSVASKLVASAITETIGESEAELIAQLHAYEQGVLAQLDEAYREHIRGVDAYFGSLERLAEFAFDSRINLDLRLNYSVRFAERVGVPDEVILRTTEDLDKFMTE